MTVIDVVPDVDNLQLTLTADFAAPVERVWQVWADPRQLERWWGPPTWPATFVQHDLVEGSMSKYYMTGPDGTRAPGWWIITSVEAPRRLTFDDGFADEQGEPVDLDDRTSSVVTLEPVGDGTTRMTLVGSFRDAEQMQKMVEMGMVEGLTLAAGQIDDILAA
ncbi:MAG: SRPBCC domain-containing protein [Candidatus Nanopelagicales bacterium]